VFETIWQRQCVRVGAARVVVVEKRMVVSRDVERVLRSILAVLGVRVL